MINEIKNILINKGMSQRGLADEFKLTPMAVSKILSGKSNPSKRTKRKMEKFILKNPSYVHGVPTINSQKIADIMKRLYRVGNWALLELTEIQNATGVSRQTIHNWATGKSIPREQEAHKINQHFQKVKIDNSLLEEAEREIEELKCERDRLKEVVERESSEH